MTADQEDAKSAMSEPPDNPRVEPIPLEYGHQATGVSTRRVLAQTAAVFVGLASVFFLLVGTLAFVGWLTSRDARLTVLVVSLCFCGLSCVGIRWTARLHKIGTSDKH